MSDQHPSGPAMSMAGAFMSDCRKRGTGVLRRARGHPELETGISNEDVNLLGEGR